MTQSGASESRDRSALERRLLLSFLQAAERAAYPYDVRQVDFQTAEHDGTVALVAGMADPIPPLGSTSLPFDTYDVILRWPVRMYLEAVAPHLHELDFVGAFILHVRDEGSSVYEMSPDLLAGHASGSVTEDAVLTSMTITRKTTS